MLESRPISLPRCCSIVHQVTIEHEVFGSFHCSGQGAESIPWFALPLYGQFEVEAREGGEYCESEFVRLRGASCAYLGSVQ